MSYHFLNNKLEDTLRTYIQAAGMPDCNVYVYAEVCGWGESIEEPFVGIRCASSRPAFPEVQMSDNVGNRIFTSEIMIRTHAADETESDSSTVVVTTARDKHAQLVGQVWDLFQRTDILTVLNDAATAIQNIGIDQIDCPTSDTTTDGRSYVTSLKFEIMCHPST